MQKDMFQGASGYLARRHHRRTWKKVVTALACVVVFCTVYALILPAITLEKTPQCGKTEHVHSEACYTQVIDESKNVLVCTLESLDIHEHTEACFQTVEEPVAPGTLSCDLEEHTHSAACDAVDQIKEMPARQEETAVSVTNKEDNSVADAKIWTDNGNIDAVYNLIKAALFSVDQGYHIQNVEYYRITDLKGSKADVTYNSGGLSADNGAKVFVYDLGADGTSAPQSCAVGNPTLDEETGLFTAFNFEIPAEGIDASHVYAFISAAPATLTEMGIYPGVMQEDGTWVAYDGANEEDANVKATITLPEGAAAPEGYRLFIRKINAGEEFYPNDEAVSAKAGSFNGWQCYTIRWITQNEDGSLQMKPLNENGAATVRIEYLKEAARLPGREGERKLLIFNSNTDGTLVDQVADSLENVRVNENSYISFTFQAAQAGPYVFVSKTMERGYIDGLAIAKIIDGSDPFDNSDTPGNDSSGSNRRVRSYDTIQYNLAATFAARQEGVTADKIDMYFELTLKKSATAARFDISKMLWMGENYSVEYLDDSDNVIMIMDYSGKYYEPQKDSDGNVVRDKNGFAIADTSRKVSINAQVNGSDRGHDSYRVASGGVATQRLVGCTTLVAKPGENILAGTQEFSTAVEVRNADNGEVFAPTFKMWLEGNEDNYGSEGSEGELMLPASPDVDNVVDISKPENQQYQVTVSAGTNFNVQLKKNTDMSYKNWFDFSTGNVVGEPDRTELVRLAGLKENHGKSNPAEFTENGAALTGDKKIRYANYRYGRITCYGITLQLYNDTDNNPSANRAAKGLKGFSLPVGDITFDLNFYSEAKSKDSTISQEEYTAILWDYNENVPADNSYSYTYVDPGRGKVTTPGDGKGNGGRNIFWDGETRSPYAKGGGPSNFIAYHDGCYYGGDWSMVDGNGNKVAINTVANPDLVTGTGANTTYHFSVRDYDFDFDNQHFPIRDAGNSGNITGYDTYARCFSAGCVQVLSVFPMVQKVSEAEIFLNTKVSNLHLTTRAGQELTAQEGDSGKINHEVNKSDNIRRDQIVLYAPGNLTKGNAFNGKYKGREPKTTGEGYLGTEYWTTSYDCSTFAGDEIWIVSYGMMASGSDYRTRSMNLLQLFDSRALSIRGEPGVNQSWDQEFDKKGEATFLYAADPDYPEGYDTNKDGVLAYMNTVREEDLVYSRERPAADGYMTVDGKRMKCVGVLMELRHCDLLGGKYQYLRIPVKVNGDDENLVGKTVATVNTFRVWSYDLVKKDDTVISWADGIWNSTTKKNELNGFSRPQNAIVDDQYSGELANGAKSPPDYVKTEYQDGLQVSGTHAGGTLAGNSLLILNYKAEVDISVDNKTSGSMISYNLGNGETVVDYRLNNIKTVVSDLTGQSLSPTTTLTINAVLDEGHIGDQRISVSGGSYRMMGYAVGADGIVAANQTDNTIGSDPENPTVLEFVDSYGKRHRIKVYAKMGENSQSVKFVLQDAPVGIQLPDITFQANFAAVTALKDNDTIKTSAYISGQGDNRAYDKAKGNTDNITVGIVMGSGTNLTKTVDTRYTELDGVITYNIIYTNSGTDRIDKIYFYDLVPYSGDIRGSLFDGKVVLREVDVTSSKEVGISPADATVYYSTTDYWELYNKVKVFGGTIDDANGKISGMNEEAVEEMLKDGKNEKGEQFFEILGHVETGGFVYEDRFKNMNKEELTRLMSTVTGLYVKVQNLQKSQTVNMKITVEAENNKADNWYKNIANSWIAGSSTLSLTSNKVETQVISRSISGVVWHDRNLNGIRDDGEPLLEGVKATLFKEGKTGYELCKTDVTKKDISPVTTGTDGAYSFDRLGDGNYIVAFSGAPLEKFIRATTYQKNGQNDANTNDGKAIVSGKEKALAPDAYIYYIRYSVGSPGMTLHSLDQMKTVSLVDGVEMYANQDLGLITSTPELPETGGTGNALYVMGGLLLTTASAILLLYRRKKCGKEGFASS